jgi:hypothetical protein
VPDTEDRQQLWDRCLESLKHITTLSTAAALLILAIYREEPFKERLLTLTLILLGSCVVISVFGMVNISVSSGRQPPYITLFREETEDALIRWLTIGAGVVFMASVIAFALAVLSVPFWPQVGILLALLVLLVGTLLYVRRRRKRQNTRNRP